MTDRQPDMDKVPQQRDEAGLSAASVGRPGVAEGATGSVAVLEEPAEIGRDDLTLAHEAGVELKARSQWAYARMRFLRHRLAVVSLLALLAIGAVALFAPQVVPYG